MLSDVQIRKILRFVEENPRRDFHSEDRAVYNYFDEIRPYVVGFHHVVRGFSCDGLSSLGRSFLAEK